MRSSPRSLILVLILAAAFAVPAMAQPGVKPATSSGEPGVRAVVPRDRSPILTAEKSEPLAGVARLELGALDRDALLAEDAVASKWQQPYRLGLARDVFLTPDNSGTWVELDGETKLWRLRVTAAEATSLSFGFTRFKLPPSASLLIYGSDETRWIRPFKAADNNEAGQLWTPLLETDDVVLELKVAEAELGQVELLLTQILQGYRSLGGDRPDLGGLLQKSGSCNIDVVCPEGAPWADEIRSVARITFVDGGVLFACSGALVNTTNASFIPYFLTANHCVETPGVASTVVAYFNFQNSTCRTPGSGASGGSGNGQENQFISGSTLRSTWIPTDFSLLQLSSAPPLGWNPHYAGWNRSSVDPDSAVAIHHPGGDEKRISFENDPVTTTSGGGTSSPGSGRYIRVADWDAGTTEGGSSGSPLFGPNKRIVGHLSGGDAACGNNDSDWYGRFSVDWNGGGDPGNRLSNWLDPTGTGNSVVNGSNPTAPAQTPAAPTNLIATTFSTTEIVLTWNDNANNETSYRVESRTAGGSFGEIGFVGANSTGALIIGLTPATQYDFRVRARNSAGNSPYSNIATATTFAVPGPCVEDATTLCLLGDRFRVRTTWATIQGGSGQGQAVELTPDTGYFWFFNSNNVEMVVKARNACVNPFNRFWVFAGGLTNVQVTMTVTDTQSGAVKTYINPQSTPFQPIQDTNAFATCP